MIRTIIRLFINYLAKSFFVVFTSVVTLYLLFIIVGTQLETSFFKLVSFTPGFSSLRQPETVVTLGAEEIAKFYLFWGFVLMVIAKIFNHLSKKKFLENSHFFSGFILLTVLCLFSVIKTILSNNMDLILVLAFTYLVGLISFKIYSKLQFFGK